MTKQRILDAFHKLQFCIRFTNNIADCYRLIINTKKYALSKSRTIQHDRNKASKYRIRLNKKSRTIVLRTYAGDLDILFEIFLKRMYAAFPTIASEIRTIVDFGANIGLASLFFCNKFPEARVFGVEPDPDNYKLLLKNMKIEIEQQTFFPLAAAITNYNGVAFIHKADNAYNTTISKHNPSEQSIKASTVRSFFNEMKLEKVDLLKIDIEGAEVELFDEPANWLSRVKVLVMECHSTFIKQHCEEVLKDNHFHLLQSKQSENLLWAINTNANA